MEKTAKSVMEKYGTQMEVFREGRWTALRGFLQNVRSGAWQNLERTAVELGDVPRNRYVYIGPPEVPAEEGDLLRCRGQEYVFRRTDEVLCGDEAVYRWGLCVKKGEDTWGS